MNVSRPEKRVFCGLRGFVAGLGGEEMDEWVMGGVEDSQVVFGDVCVEDFLEVVRGGEVGWGVGGLAGLCPVRVLVPGI